MNEYQHESLRMFCHAFRITPHELRTWITAAVDAQPTDYTGDGLLRFADTIGAKIAGDADPDQLPPDAKVFDEENVFRLAYAMGVHPHDIASVMSAWDDELLRIGAMDEEHIIDYHALADHFFPNQSPREDGNT